MTVQDTIVKLIKKNAYISVSVTKESNLYANLGFDSFSFITLLTEIEKECGITFDIMEMEKCLQVDYLIATVESKIKERDSVNA